MQENYSRRKFKDGEIIFSEGERAGEAYLVHSGNVRLEKDENGQVHEIDTIGPGKIFGEMGVISDMSRMASAIAVGDTVLTSCHRKELLQRVDELDEGRRDVLRFLITYCQDFLPYELMESRPKDEETRQRDEIAFYLIRDSRKPDALDGLDSFLSGLYKVLINYTERRLPPDFKPSQG